MRLLSSLLLMHVRARALFMLNLLLGWSASFSTTPVLLWRPLLRRSIAACMLLLLLHGGAWQGFSARLWCGQLCCLPALHLL